MEAEYISYFTVLFSFLVFVFLLQKLVSNSKATLNLPPGPRRLPFIGNLHLLLINSDPPHRVLRSLAMKYGPDLMHLKLGEITTVVASSPKAAKQVMKTHDIVFASRPSFLATEFFSYGGTDIGFAPYGEYWRKVRKICTLELLTTKRVQSFGPLRLEEFSNLCRWIASNAGTIINLTEKIGLTTYDIVTQASIGKKTEKQALFVSVAKQMNELLGGFSVADLYPSIKLLATVGGLKKKIEKLHREFDMIVESIIEEHKLSNTAAKIDDQAGKNPEDLLDVLLKFRDDPELPLTTDNIKAVLMNIFLGGIETSGSVVDWTMAELSKHPKILKIAQDEVRQLFDATGYVDESSIDRLSYLKLVIKESIRLHPPGALLAPRESREHCEIDGYQIPVKTRVIVNAWAIGRDPNYWEDPESFKPERFLEKSVDYKGNDFEFVPFGAGRRMCPGMTFGLANVELPLAMFLYHFDWILPNKMKPEELDMTDQFGIAVRRKDELHLIPVVRRPVPVEY